MQEPFIQRMFWYNKQLRIRRISPHDYFVKNPFRNLFANIIADDEISLQLLIPS